MTSRTLPAADVIEAWRTRIDAICATLPEVSIGASMNEHSAYEVRGKKFAYYLVDHHGDGRIAINCKAEPGVQGLLIDADPSRFYVPAYLGPPRLDRPRLRPVRAGSGRGVAAVAR